jgi:hypothetical protein
MDDEYGSIAAHCVYTTASGEWVGILEWPSGPIVCFIKSWIRMDVLYLVEMYESVLETLL